MCRTYRGMGRRRHTHYLPNESLERKSLKSFCDKYFQRKKNYSKAQKQDNVFGETEPNFSFEIEKGYFNNIRENEGIFYAFKPVIILLGFDFMLF